MKVDWRRALWVEHKVSSIIFEQEQTGVGFNLRKAKFLIHRLTEDIQSIDRLYTPMMPQVLKDNGPVNKPFLKSGKPAEILNRYLLEAPGLNVGGPFTRVSFEPWDFGKTGLFKDWLLKHGWIPDTWNYKNLTIDTLTKRTLSNDRIDSNIREYMATLRGDKVKQEALGLPKNPTFGIVYEFIKKRKVVPTTPKMTESSFGTVQSAIGEAVLHRMVLSHRRSLLEGLCKLVRPDGRISARANPCATPTARMRHSGVVNIPAARSTLGPEIRSLFVASKGYKFVGFDAAALEARMFAHYLNNPEFTRELLDGDIHTRNQIAAGLPTRDAAKTFLYGFLYGAGSKKLGEIVGGGTKEGAIMRDKFLASTPGLVELIEKTQMEASRGYLIGLDGRALFMRKDEGGEVATHKALNTLLQGAGAIAMKYSMVILDSDVKAAGLRARKVMDVHDEASWEVHEDDVEAFSAMASTCLTRAGEMLDMNCRLDTDVKVGRNWLDVH